MFAKLIETLKANPRTLVFTEGSDARILEATDRLKKDGFLTPILVGDEAEVKAAAAKGGFDIEGIRIVNPATYEGMDAMVEKMVELRKGKMTPEECRSNLMKGNYFGTMLVKMGEADCLLGGATYSTADTVRPALQLIKTKPGNNNVSSCFILQREKDGVDERLCMGDCAIQIDPDEDALVETALEDRASAVILAHNHVSGVAAPSEADVALTLALRPLLRSLGVHLLDHLVVADGAFVSMSQSGLLPAEDFSH